MNEEFLEALRRIADALEEIAKNTRPEEEEEKGKRVRGFGV